MKDYNEGLMLRVMVTSEVVQEGCHQIVLFSPQKAVLGLLTKTILLGFGSSFSPMTYSYT